MTAALRLAPWLTIAVAMDAAAAQPPAPALKLHSADPRAFAQPAPGNNAPIIGPRFLEEQDAWPAWIITPRANERGRRGWSFGVKPGRGLKATAKVRF